MTDIDPALRKVVAAAICPLSPPSELNSCCPQPMGEKRCQIDADAAIRAVRKWDAENGFVPLKITRRERLPFVVDGQEET